MDECELVTFIGALACTISKCSTDEEIALYASIFNQLGDSLVTILSKRNLCTNNANVENENP